MKEFEIKFEKSIIDWKGVYASFRQFWWIPVIIMILSCVLPIILPRDEQKATRYKVDYSVFIERNYDNANMPPIDNVSMLLSDDKFWEQIDSNLQANGKMTLSNGEQMIQAKPSDTMDVYHIVFEGEDLNRIDEIFDEVLVVMKSEIVKLEGFDGCRFITKQVTKQTETSIKNLWIYCLAFGSILSILIIVFISVLDRRIWSDYDLKLFFNKDYLGYIDKKNLARNSANYRIFKRISFNNKVGGEIYINATSEWIQSKEGELFGQSLGRKLHPLSELWSQGSKGNATLLMIVQKGITTEIEVNDTVEDAQFLGLDFIGCVMLT